MRNADGVTEALKVADRIAEEDRELLARLAKLANCGARGIREMTAGERRASVDREQANNSDKKI